MQSKGEIERKKKQKVISCHMWRRTCLLFWNNWVHPLC